MRDVPYWRLAGVYFFYFAYIGAFAPYFSLYLSALGIAASGIGIIMALPQAVRIPAPHLWGWLADRSGRALRVARAGATCSRHKILILLYFGGASAARRCDRKWRSHCS